MRPDLPVRPTHDDVRLTRRERRAIARTEAGLEPAGEYPGAGRHRSTPAALLVAGLLALAGAAIATSEVLAALGTLLSLCALARSWPSS